MYLLELPLFIFKSNKKYIHVGCICFLSRTKTYPEFAWMTHQHNIRHIDTVYLFGTLNYIVCVSNVHNTGTLNTHNIFDTNLFYKVEQNYVFIKCSIYCFLQEAWGFRETFSEIRIKIFPFFEFGRLFTKLRISRKLQDSCHKYSNFRRISWMYCMYSVLSLVARTLPDSRGNMHISEVMALCYFSSQIRQ